MKTSYISLLLLTSLFLFSAFAKAQTATSKVVQDERITELIKLKSTLSVEGELNDRYKIQLYSGSREGAERIQRAYRLKIGADKSQIVYETPNYKVWVGNYRNRLEADRALPNVKKEFPSAFIF